MELKNDLAPFETPDRPASTVSGALLGSRRPWRLNTGRSAGAYRLRLNRLVTWALIVLVFLSLGFTYYSASNTVSAATGINHQINFQGKLVNPSGTNVTDGSYSIVFSIYTVAAAGSNIWTETQTVTVTSGIFQVNLGSVTALPGSVDFNTDNIYLGIKVGADAEMTPRVQFTAVPQAFNSEKLGGLDKTGYIQNTTTQQATSNFNISGAGVVGTSLTTPLLQAAAATALTITGNAASTWSTSAGNITLQAGGGTISLGSTTTLSSTGALTISGGTTLALTSTGASAISLDSGTTGAVNIGTNANAKTVTIGNITGATGVVVNCGTNGCSFGASATAHPTTLGSVNSTSTTTLQAGTGGVNIGTGGIANTIQIGSTTGAVAQNINIGTNGTASSTNNVVIGSTIAGTTTIQNVGTISLNAGIVVGNATTQNLFNSIATTINFAGAATTLSIGAATSTSTFNGNLAVAAGKTFAVGTGASTLGGTLGVTGAITGSSTVQGTQLISTVAIGTAPLTVTSTTVVTNLNADMVDGLHASSFAASSGGTGYIQNQTASPQAAGFNISGNGTIGGTLAVTGAVTSGGVYLADAGTNNLVANGDFEQGSVNWTGTTGIVSGGYSGNQAAQFTGPQTLESVDYVPVNPVTDVIQLEAYIKKSVAGTTPGIMYFGYKAYDASKTVISTAPCGSYCYFAATGTVVPTDGNWHKYTATTTGEGTAYPDFPVGTKYIRVLGLMNYTSSVDAVSLVDHVTVRRINNGALFVGNNFNSTNLIDQFQQTQLYTTSGNVLTIATPSTGDVNLLNGGLQVGSTNVITAARALQNVTGYSQGSGNFSQTGAGTFGTGTGAVSLNGATSIGAAVNTTSSGGLTLKLGRIASIPSNATDAFIGIQDTGGPGSSAGDLILMSRTSTGVPNAIRMFTGQTTPIERFTIDTNGSANFTGTVTTAGSLNVNAGTSQGLAITNSSGGPWALTLNRSDVANSRINIFDSSGTLAVYNDAGSLNTLSLTQAGTLATASTIQGTQLISTVATGTAPLTVTSTTVVTNLNADMVDGLHASSFAASSGGTGYIQNGTGLQSSANFDIQSAAAGSVGGIIKGAVSQTADLMQFQDSNASPLTRILANGSININRVDTSIINANVPLAIQAAAAYPGVIIKGQASQTADLFQLQNSSGAVMSKFDASGNLSVGTSTSPTGGVATFNGNVGIGTTSPGEPLHIKAAGTSGLLRLESTAANGYSSVDMYTSSGVQAGGFGYGNASVTGSATDRIYFYSVTKDLSFSVDQTATTAMLIQKTTGNVGIGTTAPGQKLTVANGNLLVDANNSGANGGVILQSSTNYGGAFRNGGQINVNGTLAGRLMNQNSEMLDGTTGYAVYDNSAGGHTTISSVADANAPNTSGKTLRISYDGAGTQNSNPTPGYGGFLYAYSICSGTNNAVNGFCYRPNSRSHVRIWANIPVGYSMAWATNTMGTGGNYQWTTPVAGTGGWQEYDAVATLGVAGSSSFFWYVGGAPGSGAFNWNVASVQITALDEAPSVESSSNLNVGYYQGANLGYGQLLTTATSYLAVSGGNVGIGSASASYKLDVQGGDINTSANLRTGGTIRLDNAGNLSNIGTITSGLINGQTISSAANFTGTVVAAGSLTGANVISTGNVGFHNNAYSLNVPNPIWSFGNSPTYGLAYYQGSALAIGDAIGFHFGNVAVPVVTIAANGAITGATLNATTGFQVAGAATTGNYLRGNGTNFVSSAIQAADLPSGSGSYIQNGTGLQVSANFNIQSAAAGSVGGIIKGAVSQTADLFQLQNSSGAVMSKFDASGNLSVGTSTSPTGGVATFNGNVGIGTTTPVAQLHSVGKTTSSSATTGSYTGGGRGYPYWPEAWLAGNSSIPGAGSGGNTTNGTYLGGNAGGLFYGGNGTYVSGGGSGVTAIGGNGDTYGEGGAGIYAQGGTNGSWFNPNVTPYTSAPAGYFNGNVFVMNGNVGIGTASPNASDRLDVQGGDINTSANLRTGGTIRLDNAGNLSNIGTISSGLINGQTISSAANFTGTVAIAGNTNIGGGLSGRRLDVYNSVNNGDGIAIGQDTDNTQTIQTYIDNQWTNRVGYASGCCNLLKLQPDVGSVQIGSASNPTSGLTVTGITSSTSFTGYGTGLTGTASSLSIGGNAATVTDGMYLTPQQTVTGLKYFQSNKGATSTLGANNSYTLEAFATDGGAAAMSFHRGGAFAVNLGLDPDNVLRIGGWSAAANLWQLDMSGNQTLAGGLSATTANFTGTVNAVTGYKLNGGAATGQYLRGNGTNFVSSALQAADLTGTVAATAGGTGQSSYVIGDLLFASSTTALSRLADVATGQCVISGGVGVAVSWGSCGAGVAAVGALDGGTANANGATISAGVLYLQSASASYAGLMNTTTQTLAGAKTFSGAATFNSTVTVAASQSLSLVGGNTASRPGSPTEGMLYYDTTTKDLLVYANGKWQADRSNSTIIVGTSAVGGASGAVASQSPDSADFVNASTTSAQTVINAAIAALPATGGSIFLMDGTYVVDGQINVPNNVSISGAGAATILKSKTTTGNNKVFANSNVTTGVGVTIQNLSIDGNGIGSYGIYFDHMSGGSIANVQIINMLSGCEILLSTSNYNTITGTTNTGGSGAGGICLLSSNNNTVIGNITNSNTSGGIYLSTASGNTVSGNTVSGNSNGGVILWSASTNNTITGNFLQNNVSGGVKTQTADNNTITGNNFQSNSVYGMLLDTSTNNTIAGNKFHDNGGASTNNSIYLTASDSNTITGNDITETSCTTNCYAINISDSTSDTNYLADNRFSSTPGTSTINNAGTGTVYANQSTAENGAKLVTRTANDAAAFQVQNATGAGVLTVDTTNGRVGIGTAVPFSTLQVAGNLTVGSAGTAGQTGNVQITTGGASPVSNRLTFGTDGLGWKFAISKNQAGTVSDLMTIQDNGNVGIGVAAPTALLTVGLNGAAGGGYTKSLTINGTASTTGCGTEGCPMLQLNQNGAAGDIWGIGVSATASLIISTQAAGTYNQRLFISRTANLTVGGTNACTIGTGTGATSCTSDARLKNIIGQSTGNLSKIMQLQSTYYSWKSDSTNTVRLGLIAQNVQSVFPEDITTGEDGYLQLDYGALVSPLIGAVQEQQGQISSMQGDITALQQTNLVNGGTINGNINLIGNLNVSGNSTLTSLEVTAGTQLDGDLLVKGNTTLSGSLTVMGSTNVVDITVNGHIITAGNAPLATIQAAAGSNAIATITGNDTSGTITITTGDPANNIAGISAPTFGELVKILFNQPFGKAPQVDLSPGDANAADLRWWRATATDSFSLNVKATPAPNTTYTFDYFVRQ